MISASAVERLVHCPGSASLPAVYVTTEAAEEGTEKHEHIEKQLRSGVYSDELFQFMGDAKVIAVEMAFAYDVDSMTVRALGEGLGRNYGVLSKREIACTIDAAVRLPDGTVRVIDWKSSSFSGHTKSSKNWQCKVQAICVAAWLDIFDIDAGLCFLDNWSCDISSFDALDMACIAGELAGLVDKLEIVTGEHPSHLGKWCSYCPGKYHCPGRAAIVRAGLQTAKEELCEPANYGHQWEQLEAAEGAVADARKVIREHAIEHGLHLPDGRKMAAVRCTRESFDSAKAKELLAGAGIRAPVKVSNYKQLRVLK